MALQDIHQGVSRPASLFNLVRSLLSTFVDLLRSRLDLAVTELQEEGERLKRMVLLVVIVLFGAVFGLLCLTFLVVAIFWESHRFIALGGFTVFYLGLASTAAQNLRKMVLSRKKFFSATLSELSKDYERLRS